MNHWIDILAVADIPRPGARVVRHADIDIAVFRNAEDNILRWKTAARTRAGRCRRASCMAKK